MRIFMIVWAMMVGCGDSVEPGPCEYLNDNEGCDECADGDVTCTFEEVSVTELSCGGCQAHFGLFHELCASGTTVTAAEVLEKMVCEDTPTE